MEINKKSWHAKFYYESYRDLPSNACKYFWNLSVAVLLLPITWFNYLSRKLREEAFEWKLVLGAIAYSYFIVLPLILSNSGDLSFLASLGVIILITVLAVIALYIGSVLVNISFGHSPSWELFKEKYCKKIDWGDDK